MGWGLDWRRTYLNKTETNTIHYKIQTFSVQEVWEICEVYEAYPFNNTEAETSCLFHESLSGHFEGLTKPWEKRNKILHRIKILQGGGELVP